MYGVIRQADQGMLRLEMENAGVCADKLIRVKIRTFERTLCVGNSLNTGLSYGAVLAYRYDRANEAMDVHNTYALSIIYSFYAVPRALRSIARYETPT